MYGILSYRNRYTFSVWRRILISIRAGYIFLSPDGDGEGAGEEADGFFEGPGGEAVEVEGGWVDGGVDEDTGDDGEASVVGGVVA